MDELDRLYHRIVGNIRGAFPDLLSRGFEVSQLYQQIIPYRTNRRELGFDSNEAYELALMQLLAGLRGYLTGDADLQKAMRQELASPNPDLTGYRVFATSMVSLAPEALRTLERMGPEATSTAPASAASSLSPGAHAVLAGRATESLEVSGDLPASAVAATSSSSAQATLPTRGPLPPAARPSALSPLQPPAQPRTPPPHRAASPRPEEPSGTPLHTSMTLPRPNPRVVAAGESCRYCNGGLPDGRRVTFCPTCGHNLTTQHCPACATELEVGWKFCITCGREVGQHG